MTKLKPNNVKFTRSVGTTRLVADTPVASTYKTFAQGQYHSLIVSNGQVWSTGYNSNGQLGIGNTTSRDTWAATSLNTGIIHVDAGYATSFALRDDGNLYACGTNVDKQYGDGSNQQSNSWKLVRTNVADVVCGGNFTFIKDATDGFWYGSGKNNSYQLGLGHNSIVSNFTSTGFTADSVYCGDDTTLFLVGDASYVVGRDLYGQSGKGTGTQVTSITATGVTGIQKLAFNHWHSIIIKNNTLWGAGQGSSHRLGTGGTGNSTTYIDTGVKAIDVKVRRDSSMAVSHPDDTPVPQYMCTGVNGNEGILAIGSTLATVGGWTTRSTVIDRLHDGGRGYNGLVYDYNAQTRGGGFNIFGSLGVGDGNKRLNPVDLSKVAD